MTRSELIAVLLGFVAGYVDTSGFILLSGLFTAHTTGNLVLLGVSIVSGASGNLSKILAVPEFVTAIMLACVLVHLMEQRGRKPLIPVMLLEIALLLAFVAIGRRVLPLNGADDPGTLAVAALAVAAMGVQNTLTRRVLRSFPSTTVMTSNLTQVAVDMVDAALGGPPAKEARGRLARLAPLVLAFAVGAVVAGLAFVTWGIVSLLVAIAVLGCALGLAVTGDV